MTLWHHTLSHHQINQPIDQPTKQQTSQPANQPKNTMLLANTQINFRLLLSGCRYNLLKCRTKRFKNSSVPAAIVLITLSNSLFFDVNCLCADWCTDCITADCATNSPSGIITIKLFIKRDFFSITIINNITISQHPYLKLEWIWSHYFSTQSLLLGMYCKCRGNQLALAQPQIIWVWYEGF